MTRYSAGASFERLVMKYYAAKGFVVLRSAGSHGAVDVLAWSESEVQVIQCKKSAKRVKNPEKAYAADVLKLRELVVPDHWLRVLFVKHGKFVNSWLVERGDIKPLLSADISYLNKVVRLAQDAD